jgi:hypothetical protein
VLFSSRRDVGIKREERGPGDLRLNREATQPGPEQGTNEDVRMRKPVH